MEAEKIVQHLRATFLSGKTRPVEFRKQQLRQLHKLFVENKDDLIEALYDDLRKPKGEIRLYEIQGTVNEICEALNKLDEWVKPEFVPKRLIDKMNTIYNIHEPLGVSLIIAPWNYPYMLIFIPLTSAIAAGNCAVIKPSELCPRTSTLIESLISSYLDEDCYRVMQGGVEETTAILKCRFDHVFYTGSSNVGKIVMRAAAEHLSKVTLELGGKSPCYISEDSDLKVVSRRVIWGRFVNAGQTCISPDYVLCNASIQKDLVENMKEAITEFYGEEPKKSDSFGRIINQRHFNRVKELMKSGQTVIGGETDDNQKYIAPTVIVDIESHDPIMQEEIFGPVLPIINVNNEDEAIAFINSR